MTRKDLENFIRKQEILEQQLLRETKASGERYHISVTDNYTGEKVEDFNTNCSIIGATVNGEPVYKILAHCGFRESWLVCQVVEQAAESLLRKKAEGK